MGFSFGNVAVLTRLGLDKHILRGARVLDFGSQNFYGDLDESKGRELFDVFGAGANYSPDFFKHGRKIAPLMSALGFSYVAFDMYTDGNTERFDFNFDRLTPERHGAFDLIMNFGTSEHVANQFNLFQTAHDALSVGGILYNNVPFFGGADHALFNYHPKFFTSLIANNKYHPIMFDFSGQFDSCHWDRYANIDAASGGSFWQSRHIGMALITVISKKTKDAPFRPPTDGVAEGDVAVQEPSVNEILAQIGVFPPSHTHNKPTPPTPHFVTSIYRRLFPRPT